MSAFGGSSRIIDCLSSVATAKSRIDLQLEDLLLDSDGAWLWCGYGVVEKRNPLYLECMAEVSK